MQQAVSRMVPAHQRFETLYATRIERDDRLIVGDEFTPLLVEHPTHCCLGEGEAASGTARWPDSFRDLLHDWETVRGGLVRSRETVERVAGMIVPFAPRVAEDLQKELSMWPTLSLSVIADGGTRFL